MSMQDIETRQECHHFYECLLENLYDAVWFIDQDRRITYWNQGAEELTGYRRDQILGKSCCEDVLLHISEDGAHVGTGSFPAAETLRDGKLRQAEVYLRHRQGHLVAVRVRVAPIHDDRGLIGGAIEVLSDLPSRRRGLEEMGLIDPLTHLCNRRYLEMRLETRFDELARYGWTFGVVLADIENHLAIRATYGEQLLESLVQMAGKTFAACLRSFDVVGRWDAHEFLAVVPILQVADLHAIGNRVRSLIEQTCMTTENRTLGVTTRVGVAAAQPGLTPEQLVAMARKNFGRTA